MDPQLIFARTERGEKEIRTRDAHLPQRLRTVLILVDASSNVAALHRKALSLDGLETALEELAVRGFVGADQAGWEPTDSGGQEPAANGTARQVSAVKKRLIDVVIMVLGQDAEQVTALLRNADDTPEALRQAVETCKKVVDLIIDEKKAAELKSKCLSLLNDAGL